MMNTNVSTNNGKWWFKWENWGACDVDGPFNTKEEAEREMDDFVKARKVKYPHERIETF